MPEAWDPDWSNPVFSLDERERRWGRVRELMARDGIDLIVSLPCSNNHDRGAADTRYLTQLGENGEEALVAFPIDGEVTAWQARGGPQPASNWFTDIRNLVRGAPGATIVEWVREHPRYLRATIGIAGLTSSVLGHVREAEGEANWGSVEVIRRALPDSRIVSATDILGEARYQKSEEEIGFLRKATEVAEKTLYAVVEHGGPGVRERHVFAHMVRTSAAAGGSMMPMYGWISGPLGNSYHRIEQPSLRVLQPGDVLNIEIEGRWAGYVSQIDQQFSIGPATPDHQEGMKLACEAFNRVFAALKPGIAVAELLEIGHFTGMNGRGETSLIMHGRGTGDDGPLATTRMSPDLLAQPMLEGTSLVLKPSARVDGQGDYGHWGEAIVVRANGAERLGTRPQQLYELL